MKDFRNQKPTPMRETDPNKISNEFKAILDTINFIAEDDNDPKYPISSQLVNYVILRLVTYYEYVTTKMLEDEINRFPLIPLHTLLDSNEIRIKVEDVQNLKNITTGQIATLTLQKQPSSFNELLGRLLPNIHKKIKNKYFTFNFFLFYTRIIKITDKDMHLYFSNTLDNRKQRLDSDYYKLINYIIILRNKIAHDLANIDIKKSEVKNICKLLYLFAKIAPILIQLITSTDNEDIKKFYEELTLSSKELCKITEFTIAPLDKLLIIRNQMFGIDTKV